ncbi:MAG: HD domain-containing protein [bacterium]|nr:HD domain-containing protein [bacterium]
MKQNKRSNVKGLEDILVITERISHMKDIDALLDRILYEARKFTSADAGTIFLEEGDKLKFAYVQNDTLFRKDKDTGYNKYLYANQEMTIDERSIAGYVAKTNSSLLIKDAYRIPSSAPYSFNLDFDRRSNYHTKSILTVPLHTSLGNVVGVLQVINPKTKKNRTTFFTEKDELLITYFGINAANAVERAMMTRTMILRMIRMAELRDPKETGNHVNRVGAYTIEIYHRWATKYGIEEEDIKKNKDILRIAAMLHDVGKVAISDTILKKPAKLDEQEYNIMKYHTIFGARLFPNPASELDVVASEICLNHHERWDGKGYPGKVGNIFREELRMAAGKQGAEIPISSRIVALADVYDALISKRVYKEAWEESKVLDYIKEQSGAQFDPEVVEAFFAIYDVIKAIRTKYTDENEN